MKKVTTIIKSIIIIFIMMSSINKVNATSKDNTEANEERSNNYLASLSVEGYDLYPEFNKFTQSYYITIPKDVKTLKINAETEIEGAKYSITGNTNLNKTENIIKVVVMSQNHLTKTYTITAIKQEDNGLALSSLEIEGVTLSQEFTSGKYYYTAETKQSKDETELKINAVANKADASVEVIGNKVVQGENLITILLTSGTKTTTYQILVNVTVEKTITTEIKNNSFIEKAKNYISDFVKDENKVMALFVAVAVILLLLVIILIVKIINKNKAKKNKEYLKNRVK